VRDVVDADDHGRRVDAGQVGLVDLREQVDRLGPDDRVTAEVHRASGAVREPARQERPIGVIRVTRAVAGSRRVADHQQPKRTMCATVILPGAVTVGRRIDPARVGHGDIEHADPVSREDRLGAQKSIHRRTCQADPPAFTAVTASLRVLGEPRIRPTSRVPLLFEVYERGTPGEGDFSVLDALAPRLGPVDYVDSLLDLVGDTPLLRLGRSTDGAPGTILAKVEYFNPGGSVKDRIALPMVEAAEKNGDLKPGGTIVEPTSGNTGVGLAMVAQTRGYRCVFVCPDKVSEDKRNVLRAYGAEVVVCPTALAPEHPESYYNTSDRLVREIEGAWKPDQYSNPNNPLSHYETTGPEVWRQTHGLVTHFVAGVGTGGTISGTGRYLKEVSDGRVQVIGVDPEGSVYSGGSGRPYLVEGVGEDFWPETYDKSVTDEIIAVSDADSFEMTRRLAREEGMLVGGSCGMAVVAALRAAEAAGPDAVVVVLLPDSGRGYLSKIFNDDWMADYGFLTSETEEPRICDVLSRKGSVLPEFVHVHPHESVGTAVAILREYDVSQLPVMKEEPPVMVAEVVGSVGERDLLEALVTGRAKADDPLERHMAPPLPMVGSGEAVSEAVGVLEKADAAVVLVDGKPAGLITRQDLLGFLAGS
jgi:cystathionine beta-synthase